MNATPEIHAAHPIVRNITLMYGMSIVIAILVAVASLAGLTYRSIVYPTEGLQRELVPTDWVNLCLGLPVLLGSMWLARRGRLIGLMCWPGAIFFILYTYLIYVFAMHFNAAFLVHLSLVTLSLYTLISLVASIDGKAIQRFSGATPIAPANVAVLLAGGLVCFVPFAIYARGVVLRSASDMSSQAHK